MHLKPNDQVVIFDTTLRDGEQGAGAAMSAVDKLAIAKALENAGVDVIEAGFPASSPGSFNVVKEIAEHTSRAVICALARGKEADIDAATASLALASDRARVHIFIATDKSHMVHKLRLTPAEVLQSIAHHVSYATTKIANVEFSPEVATTTEPAFLLESVKVAIASGATIINVPDTTGYSLPHEYGEVVAKVVKFVSSNKNVMISVHCHNDRGLATANTLAGVKAGARQVECTVNGIGERAGNTSLEEVVMAFTLRPDHYGVTHNIDTTKLVALSQMVESATGLLLPANKAFVGRNAFAHESGIHQDATLKHPALYEICDPSLVGATRRLPIGKLSGRSGLSHMLCSLGINVDTIQLGLIYDLVMEKADKEKSLSAADFHSLAQLVLHPN